MILEWNQMRGNKTESSCIKLYKCKVLRTLECSILQRKSCFAHLVVYLQASDIASFFP